MTIGLLAGLHHHELAKKGGKAWAVTYHGGCRCQSFPMEKTSFKRDDRVERELFGFCQMNSLEWESLWDELKTHDVSAHLIRTMQCVLYFRQHGQSQRRHKGQQWFEINGAKQG